jgi:hypothetical protein
VRRRVTRWGTKRRVALVCLLLLLLIGFIASDYFLHTGLISSGLSAPIITRKPSNPTSSTSATFRYVDSQPGVDFRCSLDSLTFTSCATGGVTFRGLDQGTHTFQVEAVLGSVVSPTTSFVWAIIPRTPPSSSVRSTTAGPFKPTASTSSAGRNRPAPNGAGFTISADLAAPLYPGTSQELDLVFTNPNPSPISVAAGAVSIAVSTVKSGCKASVNFAVAQSLTAAVTIPAHEARSLSQLGVSHGDWPVIAMVGTDSSQDACQDAALTLHYSAGATG